ncbi:hypothetical protein KIS4809_1056 [Bacillus sp. ZZV12-4809]|nr:hypothetical protein KIS4809_1056 [Bacillus sp. ZZV12-4809]
MILSYREIDYKFLIVHAEKNMRGSPSYCGSNLDKLNEEPYFCYFCSKSMSESKTKKTEKG